MLAESSKTRTFRLSHRVLLFFSKFTCQSPTNTVLYTPLYKVDVTLPKYGIIRKITGCTDKATPAVII